MFHTMRNRSAKSSAPTLKGEDGGNSIKETEGVRDRVLIWVVGEGHCEVLKMSVSLFMFSGFCGRFRTVWEDCAASGESHHGNGCQRGSK